MTDARLPDQWLGHPKFDNWEAETWVFFARGLMWSNRYGTDGRIPINHARTLALDLDLDLMLDQIESSGMCTRDKHAIFLDWQAQTLAKDLQAKKHGNKVRSQLLRDRKKAGVPEIESMGTDEVTHDVTRDVTHDVGQDRLGQDDTF